MLDAERRAAIRWHDAEVNTSELMSFATYQRSLGLSERTIKNRASILRPLGRAIGKSLLEATTADLREYLAREGVKPGTKRIERAAMVAFYGFMVDEGVLEVSPAAKLAPVKVARGEPRPFSREQVAAMLNSGAYRRTRAMILLGYFQGFRVSQIATVKGTDLDFLAGTIRTVAKGGKERLLPLHPVVAAAARTMPSDWWFPSPYHDGPIRSSSVTDAITEAKRRAGITDPRLTPHSLRHSFGSELVEQGVDIRVVQELMLHEDLSTTQVYTRVSDRRKRDGIATLEALEVPEHSARRLAA